jgi:hypothetical protein
MKQKAFLAVLLLLAATRAPLPAQSKLSVDIGDPVYQLLELGEMKGILSRLSAVRPYPRSRVIELLERMWGERSMLSPAEQAVLVASLQPFYSRSGPCRPGETIHRGIPFMDHMRLGS